MVRFGDFEADRETGELCRQGRKIRLQEKPFQILSILLEKPGQVVTREELRQRLWPEGTFVDFDQGLNKAVGKLRNALADSAESPRFIETVPRRGYRFIAPVELEDATTLPAHDTTGEPVSKDDKVGPRYRVVVTVAAVSGAMIVVLALMNWKMLRERMRGSGPTTSIESLAVLPFDNLMDDREQDYFVDGMTDLLIAKLAQLSSLRVTSRTSVMHYKDTRMSMPDIARELNVDAVVEGTVLRSGDRVRITARLVEATIDRHLWVETYERDLRDVMTLQSELAQAISREVQVVLTQQERERLAEARPINPRAHEAYLKGRHFWNQRSPEGLKQGLQHFEQATQIDPDYAAAYAGVADSYLMMGHYQALEKEDAYPKARAAATKALEMDDTLAEAHTSLAAIREDLDWDWAEAEKEYERAIELNPSYATAHHWYAMFLSSQNRHREAIGEIERAQELNPFSININTNVCWVYLVARQLDRAMEECKLAIEMDENYALAHYHLGTAYGLVQRFDEAITEFQKASSRSGDEPYAIAGLGYAYALGGYRVEAEKILAELELEARREHVEPIYLALVHVGLRDNDQAIQYLEEAYAEHGEEMSFLNVTPAWDPLRSDPRFTALLKQMGLER